MVVLEIFRKWKIIIEEKKLETSDLEVKCIVGNDNKHLGLTAVVLTGGHLQAVSDTFLQNTVNGAAYFIYSDAGGEDQMLLSKKSTYSALPNDYNCKVELAMTSDGKTIICYHPSVDTPYEHTKPLPRLDPLENHEESHEQVLKARLKDIDTKQGPTMEELSKMFYTTKHRWYPVGQYHRRRMKKDLPKDR
ncbi:large ribosomal subunit protein mL42 [Gastrophryne carolinensis]